MCEKYTGRNSSSGRDAAEKVLINIVVSSSPREPWPSIIAPIL